MHLMGRTIVGAILMCIMMFIIFYLTGVIGPR